jgi:hypothetical protein
MVFLSLHYLCATSEGHLLAACGTDGLLDDGWRQGFFGTSGIGSSIISWLAFHSPEHLFRAMFGPQVLQRLSGSLSDDLLHWHDLRVGIVPIWESLCPSSHKLLDGSFHVSRLYY